MPETIALFRLSLARNRWLLFWMIGAVAVGLSVALYIGSVDADNDGAIGVLALFLSLMPATLASIVLFDYGQEGNMNLPESGCSRWLLRMPVRSWKIAAVPILLRTAWVAAIWTLFILITRHLGANERTPLVAPIIAIAAATVWILVIAWRPFRSAWRRLVAMFFVAIAMYFCIAATLAAPHLDQIAWRPTAVWASCLLAIAVYVSGAVLAIRSIRLARYCGSGIIPASPARRDGIVTNEQPVRIFASPVRALAHHDFIKCRDWRRRIILVLGIPAIIFLGFFVPLNVHTVGLAMVLFAYIAGIAMSRSDGPTEDSQLLAPYLAASPLSNVAIAFTRFLTALAIAATVYSGVFVVLALWACWPENRELWMQWAGRRAEDLATSADPLRVGLGWSAAILLAWPVFFLSRIAAYIWPSLTGRPWVTTVTAILGGLSFLIPAGIALTWFNRRARGMTGSTSSMVFTADWKSVRAELLEYWAMVPYVLAVLVGLKLVAGIVCAVVVSRGQTCNSTVVFRVIAAWALFTVSVAVALVILIPDPRVTLLWCLAVTVLLIPLSRVLVLPLAVAWNRHR